MRRVKFVEVTQQHIDYVAEFMRTEDQIECQKVLGKDPLSTLEEAVKMSEFSRTAILDNYILGICGLASLRKTILQPSIGVPWALTTVNVSRFPKEFYLASKNAVHLFQENCDVLLNYVDANYEKAIKWLKRLGFTIGEIVKLETNYPIRLFIWRKDHV